MFGEVIVICGLLAVNALENLSVGKAANQTDTGWGAAPSRAVDGDTNSHSVDGQSCSTTLSTTDAWWEVDLGTLCRIDHVIIFGRTDCCSWRLREVQLFIGRDRGEDDYVLQGYHEDIIHTPYTFQMTPVVYGRFVKITRPSTINGTYEYLTLCEVQVMGEEISSKARFEFHAGKIGTGNVLKSSQARTEAECCIMCEITVECSAVNYNSGTKVCQVLDSVTTTDDSSNDNYFYRQ